MKLPNWIKTIIKVICDYLCKLVSEDKPVAPKGTNGVPKGDNGSSPSSSIGDDTTGFELNDDE